MPQCVIPDPRLANRQSWPWAPYVCVGSDGSQVEADGTLSSQVPTEPGTCPGMPGRMFLLQTEGNRWAIFDDSDRERLEGIWFAPASIVRARVADAVTRERELIEAGTLVAMRTVSVINVGGRQLARRAFSWRARGGPPLSTEWLDADYLDWETYSASAWPRTPAPRVPEPRP